LHRRYDLWRSGEATNSGRLVFWCSFCDLWFLWNLHFTSSNWWKLHPPPPPTPPPPHFFCHVTKPDITNTIINHHRPITFQPSCYPPHPNMNMDDDVAVTTYYDVCNVWFCDVTKKMGGVGWVFIWWPGHWLMIGESMFTSWGWGPVFFLVSLPLRGVFWCGEDPPLILYFFVKVAIKSSLLLSSKFEVGDLDVTLLWKLWGGGGNLLFLWGGSDFVK
jgi:hypothetical protein